MRLRGRSGGDGVGGMCLLSLFGAYDSENYMHECVAR